MIWFVMLVSLFNGKQESFQIVALRMVDAYRMVKGVLHLMYDAYVLVSHCRCREGDGLEVFHTDGLRTGEGEEETAGLKLLHCFAVDVAISFDALLFHTMVFGKCRWIEYDEIIGLVGHLFQELEYVLTISAVAFSASAPIKATLASVSSMALREMSTESTCRAPPCSAYIEKPPE